MYQSTPNIIIKKNKQRKLNPKPSPHWSCDVYQITTLMNPIEVLIKSIASPRTKLTKETLLGLMFHIVWFYDIEHNIKSDHSIKLKLYQVIPKVLFYIGIRFQVNQCSIKQSDTG